MAKRNKHRKKNPKWHYSTAGEIPIYVPFLGAVDFLLFFILFLIALYQSAGIPVLIGLGLFCLLGLVLILTVNQKITYTPENFTYRDMLRISHTYSYSQIKKIRCGKDVTIHVGHRIILIDQMAGNGKKFAHIARMHAPDAEFLTPEQAKLFGGNVYNPGEFVFCFILVGLMPVAAALFLLHLDRAVSPKDLYQETCTVTSYQFTENDDGDKRLELELRHASQRVDDLAAQGGRAFDTLEYLTPPARSRVDTAARLARVEAEIAQRRQVLAQSQGRLEQLGNSEEAQARASQLEGHRLVRLEEYDALELAMKVLSDANDELRQRFSPALNQEAARILSALTGGRYQHLTLSRDFSAQAGPGNALPRSALYLSAGTLDQLYLALRLAICQLTLPGIPLVLDDALVPFDDRRMALALDALAELGRERQILLFTCQEREGNYLEGRPGVTRTALRGGGA